MGGGFVYLYLFCGVEAKECHLLGRCIPKVGKMVVSRETRKIAKCRSGDHMTMRCQRWILQSSIEILIVVHSNSIWFVLNNNFLNQSINQQLQPLESTWLIGDGYLHYIFNHNFHFTMLFLTTRSFWQASSRQYSFFQSSQSLRKGILLTRDHETHRKHSTPSYSIIYETQRNPRMSLLIVERFERWEGQMLPALIYKYQELV